MYLSKSSAVSPVSETARMSQQPGGTSNPAEAPGGIGSEIRFGPQTVASHGSHSDVDRKACAGCRGCDEVGGAREDIGATEPVDVGGGRTGNCALGVGKTERPVERLRYA